MGIFQLELIYFSFHRPSIKQLLFLSCRPFVVITLSTGLVGVEVTVNCPSQETEVTSTSTRPVENVVCQLPKPGDRSTSTSTRPVENVVLTTKGLNDRNNLLLDGRMVENKGKLILTEIFPSVQNMIFKSIDIILLV